MSSLPGPDPGALGTDGEGGNLPGVDPEPRLVELIATDHRFEPHQLRAEPGEQLIVSFHNQGQAAHNIVFELHDQTFALDRDLAPGESGDLHIIIPVEPGGYAFHCPSSAHVEEMSGELLVLRPPAVRLEEVARGFVSPIGLVAPPADVDVDAVDADDDRLFVIDQVGSVRVLTHDDGVFEQPFLDLRERMVELDADYDERGLLGFAFHPDFARNGRVFAFYSAALRASAPERFSHTNYVSEFTVSGADKNRAELASEHVLLAIDQPQPNHNGGTLAFGPDGLLYVAVGDGGGEGDLGIGHTSGLGNAQDVSSWHGKLLRLDVEPSRAGSDASPYHIPDDNPFVGRDGADEVFAYGFRNPVGFSFDSGGRRRLYVPDPGQALWEEISLVELGGNYGWRIREGTHCFDPADPLHSPASCTAQGHFSEPLLPPVIELANAAQPGGLGAALIGGHVYRGDALPALAGRYVFGTFARGVSEPGALLLVASDPDDDDANELWPVQRVGLEGHGQYYAADYLKGIGRDADDELYLLVSDQPGPTGDSGRVLRLEAPAN